MENVHISLITKPLLAARVEKHSLDELKYPIAVSDKVDGIRCLKLGGKALTRTFHRLPNKHTRELIEKHIPDGMDMELTAMDYPHCSFQETTGMFMREDSITPFKVWIIDYVDGVLDEPYINRITKAERWLEEAEFRQRRPFQVHVLIPKIAQNRAELEVYEAEALGAGYEGIMVRDMQGRYKCGRSTFSEQILIKIKRFSSMEARVISVEPLMRNNNEAEKDAFGRTKRSTAKDGLIADTLMGRLVVVGINGDYKDIQFEVGTGFTQIQRDDLWKRRKEIIGDIATITYFPTGVKNAPRFPVFRNWRHPDDM